MASFPAVLSFRNLRNCFGYLNDADQPSTSTAVLQAQTSIASGTYAVQALSDNRCIVIQIHVVHIPSQKFCNETQSLFLDSIFARSCGFNEGDQVVLEQLSQVPACVSVHVRPSSYADWRIIDSCSSFIENNLIGQLQIVAENVTYPLFIDQDTICYFNVEKIVSKSAKPFGFLIENTALHVTPVLESDNGLFKRQYNLCRDDLDSLKSVIERLSLRVSMTTSSSRPFVDEFVRACSGSSSDIVLRVLPSALISKDIVRTVHPTAVFTLLEDECTERSVSIVSLQKRGGDGTSIFAVHFQLSRNDSKYGDIRNILEHRFSHCLVSPSLLQGSADYTWLTCSSLSMVNLRKVQQVKCIVSGVVPESFYHSLVEYFRCRCAYFPVVMGSNGFSFEVVLSDEKIIKCRFCPSTSETDAGSECYIFACDHFPDVQFVQLDIVNDGAVELPEGGRKSNSQGHLEKVVNWGESEDLFEDLLSQTRCVAKIAELVNYCLEVRKDSQGHLLVTGPKLSGKNTIVRKLLRLLFQGPSVVFSTCIDCLLWRGKAIDFVEKQLSSCISLLNSRRPSLLVLENIDFSAGFSEEENRDIKVEKVFSVLRRKVEQNRVFVISTAKEYRGVHKVLSPGQGKRFFFRTVNIEELKTSDRLEALKCFIQKGGLECGDLQEAVNATNNYLIGDLKRISQRIILEAISKNHKKVDSEDIRLALERFVPITRGMDTAKKSFNVSWDDVGGMSAVKTLLTEVFIWPSKYPELYSKCPVRLGRGVLLHGPTGCGKTLIAKAVATESGLSVIHIKGPELLSKYIGQSEENVRNTFERARTSKPCLILIDEFDSLGPTRGHDSTGVTDRVVNQLLTELDGVEALEGVYLLATTNRLDLIDPALTRPGRFDRIVKCCLPDRTDREFILEVLCSKVNLHSDVDLPILAARTESWSGADLKGLVTSAQFYAASSALSESDNHAGFDSVLSMQHFATALKDGKPSKCGTSRRKKSKVISQVDSLVTHA